MTQEEKEVILDQPFGSSHDTPAGEEPKKETEEIKEVVVEDEPSDKPRIPYSRFENVSRARREAEAEAEKWRQRALELEEARFTRPVQDTDVPAYWLELYGDTEQTRKAYSVWQKGQESELRRVEQLAEQKALEAVERQQKQQTEAYEQNLSTIEDGLTSLEEKIGRVLTEKEEDALLSIVDEYTPQEDGQYLGALLPFEKAWEIYELKTKASKEPSKKSRDNVATIISAGSNSLHSDQAERDKQFRPGVWGQWVNRLPKE